jgi:uncharacterized repeat protein (TIGR03803 family)
MLSDLGDYLFGMTQRTADVRDATITGYEGNGVYLLELADTGGPIRGIASVGMGKLAITTQCVVAPMAAAGNANAPWRIISADNQVANLPNVPPAEVAPGPSVAHVFAMPTILVAGGDAVNIVIEGSGLTAGPTYGDPGIEDFTAPDITSTRIMARVKALATVATGTISTSGTDVTGTGTNGTHFTEGQLIIIGALIRRIDTIADDTHWTIDEALPDEVTDSSYAVAYSLTIAGVTVADFFQVVAAAETFPVMYGVATEAGAHDGGTLFRFDSADNSVTSLYDFDTTVDAAWAPSGMLAIVGDVVYFACSNDGGGGNGAIFKFALGSSTLTLVHAFDGTTGSGPYFGVLNVGGKLYGVTNIGGAHDAGVAFKIDPADDSFSVLHEFDPDVMGKYPSGLTYDGTAIYGVTGGSPFAGTNSFGTVFRINGDDSLDLLYAYDSTYFDSFGATNLESANGINDGETLYLVLQNGGADAVGCIDKLIISSSTRTREIEFTSAGDPGQRPEGPLSKIGAVFYGTTSGGGPSADGAIFKYNPAAPSLTGVLEYDGTNGTGPSRGGLLNVASRLWIVTPNGGAGDTGTIGKLNPSDDTYSMLHEFVDAEGRYPYTGLISAT